MHPDIKIQVRWDKNQSTLGSSSTILYPIDEERSRKNCWNGLNGAWKRNFPFFFGIYEPYIREVHIEKWILNIINYTQVHTTVHGVSNETNIYIIYNIYNISHSFVSIYMKLCKPRDKIYIHLFLLFE